jgi:hypothetical protein
MGDADRPHNVDAGRKTKLRRTLGAAESAKTAGFGVPSPVPKWRARHGSNM